MLQVHDQRAERVAVGRHEDRFTSLHKGQDMLTIVWKHTFGRQLERLTTWWGHVERAAPNVHLFLAPLLTGVILVKTSEFAVVTLIQGLVLRDGDALLTNGIKLNLERLLSTLQVRSKSLAVLLVGVSSHFFPNILKLSLCNDPACISASC